MCVWLWAACVHLPPEEIKHTAQHPSSCQSLPFISLPLSLFHTFWINRLWFTYYEPMSPPISVFLSLFFSSLSIFLPFPQSLIPVSLSRSFITPPPPFILHHNLSLPTVSPLTPSLNLSLSLLSLLISPRPIPLLSLSLSLVLMWGWLRSAGCVLWQGSSLAVMHGPPAPPCSPITPWLIAPV